MQKYPAYITYVRDCQIHVVYATLHSGFQQTIHFKVSLSRLFGGLSIIQDFSSLPEKHFGWRVHQNHFKICNIKSRSRICRNKIHCGDRKILGTDCSLSYVVDCRVCRIAYC